MKVNDRWMDTYKDSVKSELSKRGIQMKDTPYGIYVWNGIDEWLIDIRWANSQPDVAHVKLYHKNIWNGSYGKKGKRVGGIPDMHLQWSKMTTDKELVQYILHHTWKYKMH